MSHFTPQKVALKNGQSVQIRSADLADAAQILGLSRSVIAEEIFGLTTTEEFNISLEDEQKWILLHSQDPNALILVATVEDKIVGLLNFASSPRKRTSHTGEFGMSVAEPFRSQRVGSALLAALLEWASANPKIEKVTLQVHGNNNHALELYRKFGFEVEGVKIRDLKYGPNAYVDSVIMARFIQR